MRTAITAGEVPQHTVVSCRHSDSRKRPVRSEYSTIHGRKEGLHSFVPRGASIPLNLGEAETCLLCVLVPQETENQSRCPMDWCRSLREAMTPTPHTKV